jgi:hypothetical protein
LTEWLGPDFDGVIAFDEAHLMKNAPATKRGSQRRPGIAREAVGSLTRKKWRAVPTLRRCDH